ncbi:hypothetical protein ONZ45_g6925 [Pleurotus djamor]|nr:hypothetical protein ONZ45_g6925 [Pleurotus djamor]
MIRGDVALVLKAIIPSYIIGFTLSLVLYGTLLSQAIAYFRSFSTDQRLIRLLVAYLLAVETALTVYDVWNISSHLQTIPPDTDDGVILSGSFDNCQSVFQLPLVLMLTDYVYPISVMQLNTVLTVLVSTPVQCFYAWRLRTLQGSKFLTVLMYVLSVVSLITGIITAVVVPRGIPLSITAEFIQSLNLPGDATTWVWVPTLMWLGTSALADVLITGALSYRLIQLRTGMKGTDNVVNSIIQMTVETGLLTSACIIAEIILFVIEAAGDTSIAALKHLPAHDIPAKYVIADFVISKLYANTLFVTLNARTHWRMNSVMPSVHTEDVYFRQ